MSEGWVRAVVRARALVLVFWAVVAALGVIGAGSLSSRLSTSLDVPGTPSAAANAILARSFHENADGSFTVVVSERHLGTSRQRALRAELSRALAGVGHARVVESHAVAGVWYAVVSTPLDLASAATLTDTLRHRLATDGPAGALLTGPPALQSDLGPVLRADLARGLVVALVAAVLLLALTLGVGAALLVPFVVALATTGASLAVLEVLARHLTISLYAPNLVELVGLGLAVDYALLLVHRLREEATSAPDPTAAVVATMATAGRTVVLSGLVVAVGLAALLVEPVGFVRSLGVAGLVVALAAVASALSLAPALLSLLGPNARRTRTRRVGRGAWIRLARGVLARRRIALAGSLTLLLALASPLLGLHLTPLTLASLPRSMASVRALDLVSSRLGPGVATPLSVVVDTHREGGDATTAQAAARLRLATALSRDREVEIAAVGTRAPFVADSGRYAQIDVVARAAFGSPEVQALVARVRHRLVPAAHFPSGTTVDVGGAPAQGVDFLARVYSSAPLVAATALLVTSLLVGLALSSWVLALLSGALALLSQAAALGITVAVVRLGLGPGAAASAGQVEGWVPVFLFALLLGLSTDYQVFILARVREAFARNGEPDAAVQSALERTGGVVSAAALVMVGALAGLVVGRVAGLSELGLGLAAGVLVDVVVVRGVVLPSALGLLGRRALARPGEPDPPPVPATGDGRGVGPGPAT
ncbi:MAG TPA: MMPL family transporter [Acidimicrobiales bacterium]|nr:MAG: hypothetical protein B7Z69_00805 [Actinobacteria bacterium 21-73-9]HQU26160.1 MMPL family transporter [Acidimicrobiales bacterium]